MRRRKDGRRIGGWSLRCGSENWFSKIIIEKIYSTHFVQIMKKILFIVWSIPFFILTLFLLIMSIDAAVSGSGGNFDHLDPDREYKTYYKCQSRIDSIRYNNHTSFTLRRSVRESEEERLYSKHKYFISYTNQNGETILDSLSIKYNESKTQEDYAIGNSISVYVNSNRTSPTISEEEYNSKRPSSKRNTLVIVICLVIGTISACVGYFLVKTGRKRN